ncbi:hypothetical protein H5410_007556 [Solanum commersonii]|uniref:Uncharacterized protein n=1 Tax=Solanum commersonii TaxID=4109 RepID=A0A9J6ADW5_SOLCO|nr:hypothetical protein H5410_007556 [Solanum commersonii]
MESCYFTVTKPSSSSSTILNFQGVSSFGGRSSQKSLGAPSYLSWPLSRPEKKHQNFVYRQKTFKGAILAEAGKQGWDFGRFIKTLYFFNGPPSLQSKPVNLMDSSGITLVTGATGGVGRRVVDVRNEEKARRMLGEDVDLVVGDVTKASTLLPEYFKGVNKRN